ncbi:MAG: AsmA family protein, partial [candidate division Zixibacteria bacterium]|nr:AsmA family protein [candidate division Zixibacteria bacterium]
MKKLLKILLWLAGIFLVVLILAVVGLKLFFPAEKIKALAIETGSEKLGREITVEGIDVSIWGGVGVQLEKVTVSNAAGFEPAHMLTADHVDVKVQLWPLIRGNIQVDKLIVEQPRIVLHKKADGSNNFTFAAIDEKAPPELVEGTPSEARAAAAVIAFDKLEINGGNLSYTDDSSAISLDVVGLDIASSLATPRETVYRSSGTIKAERIALTGVAALPILNFELDYGVEYDLATHRIELDETDLEVNGLSFLLRGEATVPSASDTTLQGRGNVKAERIAVADLFGFFSEEQKAMLADYDIAGEFGLDLDIDYDDARDDPMIYNGAAEVTDMRLSRSDIAGELRFARAIVDFKPNNLRLNIEDGTFDGQPLKGHLVVDNFDDPTVNGELAGRFNLAFVQPFLPAEGQHQLAGESEFDLKFSGNIKEYQDIDFSGSVAVTNGRYNSVLLPEPIDALTLELYFDNNVLNIRSFSSRTASGDFNLTGRIEDFLPYLMANSANPPDVKPVVDLTLDGSINLA